MFIRFEIILLRTAGPVIVDKYMKAVAPEVLGPRGLCAGSEEDIQSPNWGLSSPPTPWWSGCGWREMRT